MTLQLMHKSDYLFVIDADDSKKHVLKALLSENFELNSIQMVKWNLITHHLPLNNAPVLEGIELLPPLEDDEAEKLAESEYPTTRDSFNEHGWDESVSLRIACEIGYNKAKEDYKFTEEDMLKAKDYGNGIGQHKDMSWNDFIQSLSQPKLPTSFDTETKQYIYEI